MAEIAEPFEHAPTRRQLLLRTRAMLAVGAAATLIAGWNVYRDLTTPRGARGRRRKWKWGGLALLWCVLAAWSERHQPQRDSSIS
jgi:hypothetical protein